MTVKPCNRLAVRAHRLR